MTRDWRRPPSEQSERDAVKRHAFRDITICLALGSASATVGWWQPATVPVRELASVQLTMAVALFATVTVIGAGRLLLRPASLSGRISFPRSTVIVASTAMSWVASMIAIGARPGRGDLLVLAVTTSAAFVCAHLRGGLTTLVAALATASLWWTSSKPMAVGVLIVVVLASAVAWAWPRRGGPVSTPLLAGLVAASVAAVCLPHVSAIATERGSHPLALQPVRVSGRAAQQMYLFNPRDIAVSDSGQFAALDWWDYGRHGLWITDDEGQRLVVGAAGPTSPDGAALLGLAVERAFPSTDDPEYRVQVGRLLNDGTSFSQRLADDLAHLLPGTRVAPDESRRTDEASLAGTQEIAYGGEVLYGASSRGLWTLVGDTPTWAAETWGVGDAIDVVDFSISDSGEGALLAWVTPRDSADSTMTLYSVDLASGQLDPIHLVDDGGVDIGSKFGRSDASPFSGLTTGSEGAFLTVCGRSVIEFRSDGRWQEVGRLPDASPPVRQLAATGDTLYVGYDEGEQGVIAYVWPPVGPNVELSATRESVGVPNMDQVADGAACLAAARAQLQPPPDVWRNRLATSPRGYVSIATYVRPGCAPTGWTRTPDGQLWTPVAIEAPSDHFRGSLSATTVAAGELIQGFVLRPVAVGGDVVWWSPSLGGFVIQRSRGVSLLARGPTWAADVDTASGQVVALAAGTQWWFVVRTGEDLDRVVSSQPLDPSGWTVALELDGITDIDVTGNGTVLLARCNQVIAIDPAAASPAEGRAGNADTGVAPWRLVVGSPLPASDETGCAEPGVAGSAVVTDVNGAVVGPVAVASVPHPDAPVDDFPAAQLPAVRAGPEDLVYVADVGLETEPNGTRRVRSRIVVVGRDGSAGADVVEPLPGGDLSELGLIPVDLDVDAAGRVCVATVDADGPGPVVLIANAVRRVLTAEHAAVNGCAWTANGELVVTDAVSGQVSWFAVPADALTASGPFVPSVQRGR